MALAQRIFVGVALVALNVVGSAAFASARGPLTDRPHHRHLVGYSVSGRSHGIRLTLTVTRRYYPRQALINATVRVQNVSHHTITVPGTSCTQTEPYVEDLSSTGKILYPDGVSWLTLLPGCGATTEDTFMAPGYDATFTHLIVVAFRSELRARMNIREHNLATSNTPAISPPLRLWLSKPKPPHVQMFVRGQLRARLTGRFPHDRSLELISLSHCYQGNAPYDYLGYFWIQALGNMVQANCTHPSGWLAIAGWFGHTAAFIDYTRKH